MKIDRRVRCFCNDTPAIAQEPPSTRRPDHHDGRNTPQTVQAVVTAGGRITFVGTENGRAGCGKDAAIRHLAGATCSRLHRAHSHFTVATMTRAD